MFFHQILIKHYHVPSRREILSMVLGLTFDCSIQTAITISHDGGNILLRSFTPKSWGISLENLEMGGGQKIPNLNIS
jgi:hypothetical protein